MATSLLFSKVDKLVPVNELPSAVIKQLHGLHAVDAALSTFLSAVSGSGGNGGVEDFLAVFDAHVGDCSCHMRAQMLWELLQHARTPCSVEWMEDVVESVRQAMEHAVTLLANVRARKGRLRGLDLGPVNTLTEGRILEKAGGDRFLAILEGSLSSMYSDSTNDSALVTPDDVPSPFDLEDKRIDLPEAVWLASESLVRPRDYLSAKSTRASGTASPASTSSKRKYRDIEGDEWDPADRTVVVRFLVICRLLSLKKEMYLEPGPPAYIRARTNPAAVYADTEAQIVEKWPGIIINSTERAKRLVLSKDQETMQSYLSQLTANWACKIAADLGLSQLARMFIRSSIATNARKITCVASYTSILPIRAEWFVGGTPVLLLVRRFCEHGYHNSFYRISANKNAWNPTVDRDALLCTGNVHWFTVKHVSLESVCSEPWTSIPHFIYIANSIDGSLSDFYARLVDRGNESLGSHRPHADEACAEHCAHVQRVLEHDFSSSVMHFFGQHEQYPFELHDKRNGYEVIADNARMCFGGPGESAFRNAAFTKNDFGTTSSRMYTCMHAYLELPVVVGRQVREMVKEGAKPAPFGYRWVY